MAKLIVTLILKDGLSKSDYADDVVYSAKELAVDWSDGTTTFVKIKKVASLLVTYETH